jgi:hypothetical protein
VDTAFFDEIEDLARTTICHEMPEGCRHRGPCGESIIQIYLATETVIADYVVTEGLALVVAANHVDPLIKAYSVSKYYGVGVSCHVQVPLRMLLTTHAVTMRTSFAKGLKCITTTSTLIKMFKLELKLGSNPIRMHVE